MGPVVRVSSSFRHLALSRGVKPQASSTEMPSWCKGTGFTGKGWVGDRYSPSTAPVWGTGRSSTGKSGSPVSRSSIKVIPILVVCTTAARVSPSIVTSNSVG